MKITTVRDYGTHQYENTWIKTEYKCPKCGEEHVWEDESYDYYTANNKMCIKCGFNFHLLSDYIVTKDSMFAGNADWQELCQLREKVK